MQTHGVEKEHGTVGAAMMGRAEDKSSSRPLQGPGLHSEDVKRHRGFQAENEVTRFGFLDRWLSG